MQKESSSKKESVLSLYTDEEIEGVSTTSSVMKNDSTLKGEVNFSEVSSTSEENNQLPSSSSKSIFMDLYEENIVDSGSDNVTGVKGNVTSAEETKPKLGLSLLGEYADSGNDTEEEIRNSLIARVKKPIKKTKKTADVTAVKNSTSEHAISKEVNASNETSNKLELGGSEVSRETCLSDDKISLTGEKGDDFNDFDIHAMLDDSLAKVKKIKEEGQLSASDSSDSERSSDGKRDSKKLKEDRKDKSKKKDRKKKKKKRKKQKQVVVEKKDPSESKVDDKEKKERKHNRTKSQSRSRSRSQEIPVKRKSQKRSKSRSTDRGSGHRYHRSRSRSQDKRKKSKYYKEKSRRSRSRSLSRKRSSSKRNKHSKSYPSRSRSRNRSTSPSNKRKMSRSSTSKTTSSRRDSPSSRKRKLSRSMSPHKQRDSSPEHRRFRSPKRRSHSPVKKRKVASEKKGRSPNKKSSARKVRSPDKRDRKDSPSPTRKSSYRTSSASDSLDSGHFTNIPLSKTKKPDELSFEDKVAVQTSPVKEKSPAVEESPAMEKSPLPVIEKSPATEKQKESLSSVPPKEDLEKQRSPSCSPLKAWEDEFDFVFTEHLSPREGADKSVEDVLFGKDLSDPKTPDFKKTSREESIKSTKTETLKGEEKKETEEKTLNGNEEDIKVCKESNVPQEMKAQQSGLSGMQSKPMDSVVKDKEDISKPEDSKDNNSVHVLEKSTSVDTNKTDHGKMTNDSAASVQMLEESDKSTFLSSKLESIPFLDEAPPPPPPISGDCEPPNTTAASQLGLLGSPPTQMGLLPTPTFDGQPWKGLINLAGVKSGDIPKSYQGLLPTPGTFPKLYSGEKDVDKVKKGKFESFGTRKEEGKNNFNLVLSPMDMEMSSPEGDIIDRLNEEFWKQQKQNQSSVKKTKQEKPKETFVERAVINKQSLFEEPYEPESGLIITEEFEEDLNNITDPKERRRRQKEQQKEKTKVQELIDKLHRQARVEEEVKHVLKAYYKHRDIDKEEYKSILRRAVPQVTNSNSSIDPERIRSLVKKYVAKIKGERHSS